MEFKEIRFFMLIPACAAAVIMDIFCLAGMLIDVSSRITTINGVIILLAIFLGVFALSFVLLPHIFPVPSVYLEEDKLIRDQIKLVEAVEDRTILYSEIADVHYSHAKKHAKNGIFIFKYNEVEVKIERIDKKPVYVHVQNADAFIQELVKRIAGNIKPEDKGEDPLNKAFVFIR